jgi:hypothetical protein
VKRTNIFSNSEFDLFDSAYQGCYPWYAPLTNQPNCRFISMPTLRNYKPHQLQSEMHNTSYKAKVRWTYTSWWTNGYDVSSNRSDKQDIKISLIKGKAVVVHCPSAVSGRVEPIVNFPFFFGFGVVVVLLVLLFELQYLCHQLLNFCLQLIRFGA